MSLLASNQDQNKNSKNELGYGDYLRFRELVLERSGLYFPEKKKTDLEAGLFKAFAASPAASADGYNLDVYYNLLCDTSDPVGRAEMSRLINTLTIGETHFFRDEAQFDALAGQVLPELIARKRAAAAAVGPGIYPQLRIWSAGCASGEEPYSLAILLRELIPDIHNWHILILATDVNEDSLARAREAYYTDWSFRENRAKAFRPRYFTLMEPGVHDKFRIQRFKLRDDIRQMVTFASLNLITDPYPSIYNNTASLDLIFCRNVTIYFAEETTRKVVNQFYEALLQGGWLVVGHSEPSLLIYRAFQVRNFPDTLLYQKTGQPSRLPDDWEWLADSNPVAALSPTSRASSGDDSGRVPLSNGLATADGAGSPGPSPVQMLLPLQGTQFPNVSTPQIREEQAMPAGDDYEQAVTLLNDGQIKEAIERLQHRLAITPDFAPAHSLLGRAYANMGRWVESQQWCLSALKLDALQAEPYYVLALVYQHEDQIQSAITMCKKAIYLDRDMPLAHFTLAMLYRKEGQMANAHRAILNTIKVLEKWPPGAVVPDSGGATARQLLTITQRLLHQLTG